MIGPVSSRSFTARLRQAQEIPPVQPVSEASFDRRTPEQESYARRPLYKNLAELAQDLRFAACGSGELARERVAKLSVHIGSVEVAGYLAVSRTYSYGSLDANEPRWWNTAPEAKYVMQGLNEYHAPGKSLFAKFKFMTRHLALRLGVHPESQLEERKRTGTLDPQAFQTNSLPNEPQLCLSLGLTLPSGSWAKLLDQALHEDSVLSLSRSVRALAGTRPVGEVQEYVPLNTIIPASVVAQLCEIGSQTAEGLIAAAILKQHSQQMRDRTLNSNHRPYLKGASNL